VLEGLKDIYLALSYELAVKVSPQYASGKWGDHSEIIYVISFKSLILYFRSSRSAPLMA
jgi:hypothetical protein